MPMVTTLFRAAMLGLLFSQPVIKESAKTIRPIEILNLFFITPSV